jgi:hypothetical protein
MYVTGQLKAPVTLYLDKELTQYYPLLRLVGPGTGLDTSKQRKTCNRTWKRTSTPRLQSPPYQLVPNIRKFIQKNFQF